MKGYIYQALGNSFIITTHLPKINYSLLVQRLSLKYQFDGLITFNQKTNKMRIYNKDGSLASMCGNGIRCLTNFIYDNFSKQDTYIIKTDDSNKKVEVIKTSPFICKVNLGRPKLVKELIEIRSVTIKNRTFVINPIFISTYHIVIFTPKIDKNDINIYIEELYNQEIFKKKFNITFFEILNYKTIRTLTYERGVGFTKSCGSGAACASYISYLLHNTFNKVKVIQEEGELEVEIDDDIYLEGTSAFVKEVSFDV